MKIGSLVQGSDRGALRHHPVCLWAKRRLSGSNMPFLHEQNAVSLWHCKITKYLGTKQAFPDFISDLFQMLKCWDFVLH